MSAVTPGQDHHAAERVVAVVGPTASGKSRLALDLACRHGGEIVNADAFAGYRGMEIGTAKPSAADRAMVVHHCLDLWEITEPASVADFQRLARAAVREVGARGRLAVVVGGSPLYVRAICDELDIPPRDPAVRARLERQARELGPARLHALLAVRDPEAARAIDPRNVRRVVRALEVVELTGQFRARLPEPRAWRPTLWLAPRRTRAALDERISARVRQMWAQGLPAEVAGLLDHGLADAPTAGRAVGYAEAMAQARGDVDAETAMAATIRATRRLARRQERTFRADPRVHWVDPDDPDEAHRLVASFLERSGQRTRR
jgi:tRNA dimethylallyltransferase